MIHHTEEQEAVKAHEERMQRAIESGCWMALVIRVEDNEVILEPTTWKFPKGEFSVALRLIMDKLEEMNREVLLSQDPLPLAEFISRVKRETADNLIGRSDEGN